MSTRNPKTSPDPHPTPNHVRPVMVATRTDKLVMMLYVESQPLEGMGGGCEMADRLSLGLVIYIEVALVEVVAEAAQCQTGRQARLVSKAPEGTIPSGR